MLVTSRSSASVLDMVTVTDMVSPEKEKFVNNHAYKKIVSKKNFDPMVFMIRSCNVNKV